jgi:hypothetical protein
MELADATNTNRKFGKPRDLLCALTPNKGPTSELANLNHALVRPKQLTGVQWRSKDGLCLASRRRAGPSATLGMTKWGGALPYNVVAMDG